MFISTKGRKFYRKLESNLTTRFQNQSVYLSANRFSIAWENEIQVYFLFSFFFCSLKMAWKSRFQNPFLISMKTTSDFLFSFFNVPRLEENEIRIRLMLYVFRFSISQKTDFNFRFRFSYGIWKTNLKFVFRFSFSARCIDTDNLGFSGNIKLSNKHGGVRRYSW